jgi:hypothetical protein
MLKKNLFIDKRRRRRRKECNINDFFSCIVAVLLRLCSLFFFGKRQIEGSTLDAGRLYFRCFFFDFFFFFFLLQGSSETNWGSKTNENRIKLGSFLLQVYGSQVCRLSVSSPDNEFVLVIFVQCTEYERFWIIHKRKLQQKPILCTHH